MIDMVTTSDYEEKNSEVDPVFLDKLKSQEKFESIKQPSINYLFPLPYVMTRMEEDFTNDEMLFIEKQKSIEVPNINILESKELFRIKKGILEFLNWYKEKVMCPKNDVDFYITNSWILNMKNGQHIPNHDYPNSIMTGTLFVQANPKLDHIVLMNSNRNLFSIETKNVNVFNSDQTSVPSERCDLLLYPSNVITFIPPVRSIERTCIMFNTFIKGDIFASTATSKLSI